MVIYVSIEPDTHILDEGVEKVIVQSELTSELVSRDAELRSYLDFVEQLSERRCG
jgi:hypothetical protein